MTYIYYNFERIESFIEIENDGYALRQVTIENGKTLISCRDDCLAEGLIDIDFECKKISLKDFEKKWTEAKSPYLNEWEEYKIKYSIKDIIEGIIYCFYPQGMIIKIENKILACAKILNSTQFTKTGLKISGRVYAYDETNMWLLLDNIKIQ